MFKQILESGDRKRMRAAGGFTGTSPTKPAPSTVTRRCATVFQETQTKYQEVKSEGSNMFKQILESGDRKRMRAAGGFAGTSPTKPAPSTVTRRCETVFQETQTKYQEVKSEGSNMFTQIPRDSGPNRVRSRAR